MKLESPKKSAVILANAGYRSLFLPQNAIDSPISLKSTQASPKYVVYLVYGGP